MSLSRSLHLKDDVAATVQRVIRGRTGGALSVFTKGKYILCLEMNI